MPDRRYRHWTNPGDGVWRCVEPTCFRSRVAFRAATQEEVRRTDTPVVCPECQSKRVIYVRRIERVPA